MRTSCAHELDLTPPLQPVRAEAPHISGLSAPAEERLHALDALRGVAMLWGVVLHGAVSYMPCRMPNLLWVVHDKATHPALDWLFWWIHSFRLPLFFALAGFFSAQMCRTQGVKKYLQNRVRRILWPLLAACALLLPLTYVIWSAGWLLSGECSPGQVLRIKFATRIQQDVYGLAHLWFLEHLLLMSLGYWAWQRYRTLGMSRWMHRLATLIERALRSSWRPVWLALPAAMILVIDLDAVAGFHNTFVPDPWRLLYYSLFFAVGVVLYRQRGELAAVTRLWPLYLGLSLPVLVSLGCLLRQYLTGGLTTWWRITLAIDMSLLAWLSLWGWLGLFLRLFNRPRPAVRWLADASYWIYLVHLPLVGLAQLLLSRTALPLPLKFLIAVALPMAASLLTYRDLVRYTWLGTFLHGPRTRSAASLHRVGTSMEEPQRDLVLVGQSGYPRARTTRQFHRLRSAR